MDVASQVVARGPQGVLKVQHDLLLNIYRLRARERCLNSPWRGLAPMIPETPLLPAQSVYYAAANCYLAGK
jgi:hypothetical protein